MIETIQGAYDSLRQLSKESPVIAGAMSLYGLGVLTYLLRGVPQALGKIIKRHTTTSLTITSSHLAFHNFMEWLHKNGYSDTLRKVKLTNGRWGSKEGATKGAGYGSHLVWYEKRPIVINLQKEETRSEYDRETLTLTKLWRGHGLFDRLLKQFAQTDDNLNKVVVYTFTDEYWHVQQRQYRREFDSVFIEQEKKDQLLRALNNFKNNEEWYVEHGIPYRLGILLHGPPGTGKTSLIKSIAAYADKNLCILPAAKLNKLLKAADKLPENSLMVIEDIDTNSSALRRRSFFDSDNNEDSQEKIEATTDDKNTPAISKELAFDIEWLTSMADGGLSEILNAIDGISDTHGRILVVTTNNPKKLDPALIRPGRIDLTLELGMVTQETFVAFMRAFFPDFVVPAQWTVMEDVTISTLQQCVLMKETPEEICKKFLEIQTVRKVVGN